MELLLRSSKICPISLKFISRDDEAAIEKSSALIASSDSEDDDQKEEKRRALLSLLEDKPKEEEMKIQWSDGEDESGSDGEGYQKVGFKKKYYT